MPPLATNRSAPPPRERLGDFTVTPRVVLIALLAVGVGAISSLLALLLLRMIGFVTNLVFFGRLADRMANITDSGLDAPLRVLIPILGGLVVGLMARYGSERIRGHGMPETIEVVLTGGSKVSPRVALFKPLSAAISIGTGGPFGAEGPIIMTGGAVGSVLAQFLKLTADERKTLLVSGSVGGMAAVFNAPLAAVLLAIELLLFEFRPRSLVPVLASVSTATVCRGYLLGRGPLFPAVDVGRPTHLLVYLAAVGVGVVIALIAAALTFLVYASEDAFGRLPFHWMWWPAVGGVIIGVGGLFSTRALGVGYATIGDATAGRLAVTTALAALVVKGLIWSLSLGSGTSGGVVAPLLFVGATAGAVASPALPHAAPGFWAAIAMGAVLAAAMGAPMTGVAFSLETTHDWDAALPLLAACGAAYLVGVLVLRRSILTEKVARKGFHVSREYDVDPLEALLVREVMSTEVLTVPLNADLRDVVASFLETRAIGADLHAQRLFPGLDHDRLLVGVLTRRMLIDAALTAQHGSIEPMLRHDVVTCYADETLRSVAYRMADQEVSRLIVVDRADPRRMVGVVGLAQLLAGRVRDLQESRDLERVFTIRRPRLVLPRRSRL